MVYNVGDLRSFMCDIENTLIYCSALLKRLHLVFIQESRKFQVTF